jgi:hypothetical protein
MPLAHLLNAITETTIDVISFAFKLMVRFDLPAPLVHPLIASFFLLN